MSKKNGAEFTDFEDGETPQVSFESLARQLIDAAQHADTVHREFQSSKAEIAEQISLLRAQLLEIEKRLAWEIDEYTEQAFEDAKEMVELLKNPYYPMSDIERTIRLTPHEMGEQPTTEARSLIAAETLRTQFLEANEFLEITTEPQPFMLVNYKPSLTVPGWFDKLYVTYGNTKPGHGLTVRPESTIGDPQLSLEENLLPQLDIPTESFTAFRPSVNGHTYFTKEGEWVSVNGIKETSLALTARSFFRIPKKRIILPTGRIFTEGAAPIVDYVVNGQQKVIHASSQSSSPNDYRTYLALGEVPASQPLAEALSMLAAQDHTVVHAINESTRGMLHDIDEGARSFFTEQKLANEGLKRLPAQDQLTSNSS